MEDEDFFTLLQENFPNKFTGMFNTDQEDFQGFIPSSSPGISEVTLSHLSSRLPENPSPPIISSDQINLLDNSCK